LSPVPLNKKHAEIVSVDDPVPIEIRPHDVETPVAVEQTHIRTVDPPVAVEVGEPLEVRRPFEL